MQLGDLEHMRLLILLHHDQRLQPSKNKKEAGALRRTAQSTWHKGRLPPSSGAGAVRKWREVGGVKLAGPKRGWKDAL